MNPGGLRRLARHVVVFGLRVLAKAVLRRYKPKVVAVTGSVGKTTTKELTAAMLAPGFRVRAAQGSYNSEFGVPLTILDREAGFTAGHWIRVFGHGLALLAGRTEYPEVLVLEMGADHPGDIRYLSDLARPDIAILTNIRGVHLMNYDSIEAIAEEKAWLVRRLRPGGTAILNFDDTKVRMMQALAPGRVVTYGLSDEANLWAEEITQSERGLTATVCWRGSEDAPVSRWPLRTPLLGRSQLSGVLAALAAAIAAGVPAEQAITAAGSIHPPPGRLRVLQGKHGLSLLDDTYNASPQAMIASLEVLRGFPGPHRAVLGTMRELGEASESGHRAVGEFAGPWLDQLVTVGTTAGLIAEAAEAAGLSPHKIKRCAEATEVARVIEVTGGGTVLFKASQAVYLERAVAELLRDPRDRSLLLDRLSRPEHQPGNPKHQPGEAAPVANHTERVE